MPVGLFGFGQVVAEIARRHGDEHATEQLSDNRVNGEAILGNDDFSARHDECVARKLDDLVGAVAEDQVLGAHAEFFGQPAFEVKGVAVGVEVEIVQDVLHRGERGGGWAERILIRSQFDDVRRGQAQLPGHFLNRAAGLVGRDAGEVGVEGKIHANSLNR